MALRVRRLSADDADAYRTLRLFALGDAPYAFGDSIEEAEARPWQYWLGLFSGERAFFGAFNGENLVGSANFMPEPGQKARHRGWLLGVYVAPEARGTGAADLLVEAVLSHARQKGALQVHLGVSTENLPAQRLYARFGFSTYGTQPRALMVDGKFIDEHHMVRFLDKDE
ncbi:GNAT family N-acetyltransferase [Pelagibacterium halotolerans]|uniref:GNAT family N-acetyltransferase n=1 Tax=Pelagibacterium halotolerans TaxID=531813 RepID=UPI00384D4C47